jgi:hypothetical protein
MENIQYKNLPTGAKSFFAANPLLSAGFYRLTGCF